MVYYYLMKFLCKKYIPLAFGLLFAVLLLGNFLAIKKIDTKVMKLANSELQTPLMHYKLRCEPGDDKPNLLFFNYHKIFKDCKIYASKMGSDQYEYKEYHTIPLLNTSYKLLSKLYALQFDKIGKVNNNNIIDNYMFEFSSPVHFQISHNNSDIQHVIMENTSSITLIHSSGLSIGDIINNGLYFHYDDDDAARIFDVDMSFDFKLTPEFAELAKNSDKHLSKTFFENNQLTFKFSVIFDRFNEDEQQELRDQNPSKYKDEKEFFKSMIYDISAASLISSDFSANIYGLVKKTSRPGIPQIDLNINMTGTVNLINHSIESIKNSFYNNGDMDVYNITKPNLMIESLLLTLEELEIVKDGDVNLHVKNDEVGGLSIGGTNFFTFQQKLMSNFIKLKLGGAAE